MVEEPLFVSVIVPTFRRPDVLATTLDALLEQSYPRHLYEIIVVDDASDLETDSLVRSLAAGSPRLAYLPQTHNGAASARNHGARAARGDLLLFVDDDIVLPADGLERLVRSMAELGPCCLNGRWEFTDAMQAELAATSFGRFRLKVERWVKDGLPMRRLDERYAEVEVLTACNLMVPTIDFWRIGGFDESFPAAGYEDQEFSLRARALGYRLIYDPTVTCWHNDRRLTRDAFLERQRRGAMTAALMWVKHPSYFEGHRALIRENDETRLREPFRLTGKKIAKSVLASRPGISALKAATDLLERIAPSTRLLERLYWVLVGLYLFRGVREGIARFSRP